MSVYVRVPHDYLLAMQELKRAADKILERAASGTIAFDPLTADLIKAVCAVNGTIVKPRMGGT